MLYAPVGASGPVLALGPGQRTHEASETTYPCSYRPEWTLALNARSKLASGEVVVAIMDSEVLLIVCGIMEGSFGLSGNHLIGFFCLLVSSLLLSGLILIRLRLSSLFCVLVFSSLILPPLVPIPIVLTPSSLLLMPCLLARVGRPGSRVPSV